MRRPSLALSVAAIVLGGSLAVRPLQAQLMTPLGPIADIVPFVDDDLWAATLPGMALTEDRHDNSAPADDGDFYDASVDDQAVASPSDETADADEPTSSADIDADPYGADPYDADMYDGYIDEGYEDDADEGYDGYEDYADDGYEEQVGDEDASTGDGYDAYDDMADEAYGYEEYDYDYGHEGYGDEGAGDEQVAGDVTYEPEAPRTASTQDTEAATEVYEPFQYELDYGDVDRPLPYEVAEVQYEPFEYEFDYGNYDEPLPYEVVDRQMDWDVVDELWCRIIDVQDRIDAWRCEHDWRESVAAVCEGAIEYAARLAESMPLMETGTPATAREPVAARVAEQAPVAEPESYQVQDDVIDGSADGEGMERSAGMPIDGKDVVIGTALLLDRLGETLQQVSRRMLVHAAR